MSKNSTISVQHGTKNSILFMRSHRHRHKTNHKISTAYKDGRSYIFISQSDLRVSYNRASQSVHKLSKDSNSENSENIRLEYCQAITSSVTELDYSVD